jgi:hypothetical protein
MGQIVRQVSADSTRYYWYPGDKQEWIRAGLSLASGMVAFGVLGLLTRSMLISVTVGTSVTVAYAGLNFGRRDFRAAHGFPEVIGKAARRAAMAHGSRAAWRGLVEGFGSASAAVLIANLPPTGLVADWVMPILPATAGALAHQAGMLYERLVSVGPPRTLPPVPSMAGASVATAVAGASGRSSVRRGRMGT